MLNAFIEFDTAILLLINKALSNPIFDYIMPKFDDPSNWIPFILLIWIFSFIKDKQNRFKLIILLPITILFCDQIGGLIKDFQLRDRPWFALGTDIINHLGKNTGQHLSFPSNHALNISGVAFLFSNIYPLYKKYFWSIALIIMYSRIYIGVHYPIDVFFGFILGCLISFTIIKIWEEYAQ